MVQLGVWVSPTTTVACKLPHMSVARSPQHQAALAAKFDGTVQAGAQLVVAAGEACVFARYGAPLRILQAGSYEVPAEYAGPDVEVWFVWTKPHVGVKFGGPLGVMPTPMGNLTKAFGEYTLRVIEPSAFFKNFAGSAQSSLPLQDVTSFINTKMLSSLKVSIGKRASGFNPGMVEEIVDEVVSNVNGEVGSSGMQVEAFGNLNLM